MEKNIEQYRYIQYAMHPNTKNMLFQPKEKQINSINFHITQFLYQLTLINPSRDDFYNVVGDLKQNYNIDLLFDDTSYSYRVNYQNIQFCFGLLAPRICDGYLQKKLFSNERKGKCHEMVISLFEKQNQLVSGYIGDIMNPNLKVLHSWIEQNINGTMYVIDPVMNLIIDKEVYYTLFEVEKMNVLKDSSLLSTFQNTFLISGKLYCFAGEEIATEIMKKIN